jgi:hypothetical protein
VLALLLGANIPEVWTSTSQNRKPKVEARASLSTTLLQSKPNMSAADSFTFFRAMPLELRLQIWGEALSVRSVWAAVRSLASDCDPTSVDHPPFSMAYVGPAPYLAGLSSNEARRLLEQAYVKPICGPSAGVHWVDMDQTVVYLGDSSDAMAVMDSFHADDLSRFKHVALVWSQFNRLARVCQCLAMTCPALCTIVIHQAETVAKAITNGPFSQSLGLETATYYATIPTHTRFELGYKKLDTDYLRSLLLEYFGASPPRLHMLPPDLADSALIAQCQENDSKISGIQASSTRFRRCELTSLSVLYDGSSSNIPQHLSLSMPSLCTAKAVRAYFQRDVLPDHETS